MAYDIEMILNRQLAILKTISSGEGGIIFDPLMDTFYAVTTSNRALLAYNTNDWSATAGEDYVATSGLLTFTPGQTTKTFTVTIKGDKKKEADETFFVGLSGASSNALLYNSSAAGTILNDDGPTKRSSRR